MNHSPNCEEWFIEKMKQNEQKLVEINVVHIMTRVMFTTLWYVEYLSFLHERIKDRKKSNTPKFARYLLVYFLQGLLWALLR